MYVESMEQTLLTTESNQDHMLTVSSLSSDGNTLRVYIIHIVAVGIYSTATIDPQGFDPTKATVLSLTSPDMSLDYVEHTELPVRHHAATGQWKLTLPPHSFTMVTFTQGN